MADEVSGWKMENYNLYNIREEILRMADDSYREFQKKLLPGTENFIGVRLPHLRRLAKRIAKEDGEAYLKASLEKESKEELFEEIRNTFQNFSIFEEDLLYIKLFSLLYDASNHRYTNMELSYELHLDVKSIKKLINKIETFVMNFIAFYSYYHPLKQYMQK